MELGRLAFHGDLKITVDNDGVPFSENAVADNVVELPLLKVLNAFFWKCFGM